MSIPPAIQALVNRLEEELNNIEQQSTRELSIARQLLLLFPNNARLIGISATLINSLFLVDSFRNRVQTIVAYIDSADVTSESIQEAGEDLSELLGRILESKILVEQAIAILDNFK